MAKGSGTTRKSTSGNPTALANGNGGGVNGTWGKGKVILPNGYTMVFPDKEGKIAELKAFKFGNAPANNESKEFNVAGKTIKISSEPTGPDYQPNVSGNLNVYINGKLIKQFSSKWGVIDGKLISKAKSWTALVDNIKSNLDPDRLYKK